MNWKVGDKFEMLKSEANLEPAYERFKIQIYKFWIMKNNF